MPMLTGFPLKYFVFCSRSIRVGSQYLRVTLKGGMREVIFSTNLSNYTLVPFDPAGPNSAW